MRLCATLRLVVSCLATLLASGTERVLAQPASFSDVTPGFMLDTDWGEGVAWGDYDSDGDLDLLLANEGQYLRLFRNDGGVLTPATPAALNVPGNWTGVTWGDYDNDGDIDLYAAQAETPKFLFRNDGGGAFTDVTTGDLIDSAHAHTAAWADYDRDGDIDLFYAIAYGGDRLLRNDGGGTFTNVTPAVFDDPQYGRGCSWADYDDDGDPDLCVANFGTSRLFRNDGGGAFTDVTALPISLYGHGGGVAWGDYDNDGDFDLFIGKAFSGNSRLYRNDGGAFVDVSALPVTNGDNSIGCQWGDFDNDADLDLYVGNFDGPNFLFRNDGGGVFSDATNPALADTHATMGFGWADYDSDGDVDLYLANNAGEPDRLLRNDNANGNHWLQIDLVGVQSNRSGIDAKVEVFTGGVRQLRRVDGGGGYNSQNTLRLHFGLGSALVVDSIRIRWPSGIVQVTGAQVGDRIMRIVERDPLVGVEPDAPDRGDRLDTPSPNPSLQGVAIRYVLAEPSEVALHIRDVAGRTVRVLAWRERQGAGPREARWDGLDQSGRRAPPGVYLVRLETARGRLERKLLRF